MDVDKQAEMVENFIDIKDLRDPDKVDNLIKRFTAMLTSPPARAPRRQRFGPGSATISADTLLAMAQLKTGSAVKPYINH